MEDPGKASSYIYIKSGLFWLFIYYFFKNKELFFVISSGLNMLSLPAAGIHCVIHLF